eukprot:CAMPEP_0119375684 /NCGR_PEP_ID=MMETSP1334-20130426/36547_1 /TAXON_ID=127549 /ORGANISM="Calcidiscus leptoporus, Strain RCC1130" /LENGTH=296 /DNA_ID=CAMNT_0007394055 /DNA_START=235 /DNA_END=1126 /DNA_ORIENTATION=+
MIHAAHRMLLASSKLTPSRLQNYDTVERGDDLRSQSRRGAPKPSSLWQTGRMRAQQRRVKARCPAAADPGHPLERAETEALPHGRSHVQPQSCRPAPAVYEALWDALPGAITVRGKRQGLRTSHHAPRKRCRPSKELREEALKQLNAGIHLFFQANRFVTSAQALQRCLSCAVEAGSVAPTKVTHTFIYTVHISWRAKVRHLRWDTQGAVALNACGDTRSKAGIPAPTGSILGESCIVPLHHLDRLSATRSRKAYSCVHFVQAAEAVQRIANEIDPREMRGGGIPETCVPNPHRAV